MDKRIIEQKIENLRNCLNRITKKSPSSKEILALDHDIQDIISINKEKRNFN